MHCVLAKKNRWKLHWTQVRCVLSVTQQAKTVTAFYTMHVSEVSQKRLSDRGECMPALFLTDFASSCTEHMEPGRKPDTGTIQRVWSRFKLKHTSATPPSHSPPIDTIQADKKETIELLSLPGYRRSRNFKENWVLESLCIKSACEGPLSGKTDDFSFLTVFAFMVNCFTDRLTDRIILFYHQVYW